jgi:hypothetical protein
MDEFRAKRTALLQLDELSKSLGPQMRCLARYNDMAESALREEIQELHDRHVKEQGPLKLPKRSPDDPFADFDESGAIQAYYDRIMDDIFDLSQMMPLIHRWATFAVTYSTLEINLDRVARICSRGIGSEQDYKPDDREVISCSCNYLSLILQSPFPSCPDNIDDMNCLRIIRNTLLHSEGHIREKHKHRLNLFAKSHGDWMRITPRHNIYLSREAASLFVALLGRVLPDALARVQKALSA